MISVTDKRKCSGCKACSNSCSLGAISFKLDEEGFWYPKVDLEKCVNCRLCENACPFNDPDHGIPHENREYETQFFAAQLKEESHLFEVSSGGAFQAIAETVIKGNGIVYGVAQKNVDCIFHIRAKNLEELKQTRRSKYLQSDIKDCYQKAKFDLQSGNTVLFSGTGCQIAGLNCFLNKRYDNLYTCEVICHGVPSQKIWEKYRKEKERREGKKIKELVFRDKSKGWSCNQYKIIYDDGTLEYERSTVQLFHAGYLQGLFYRPSCGSCPFASMPRVADITLADYWKYKGALSKKDIGISLVAVNNLHGRKLLELSSKSLIIESTSRDSAFDSCRHMDEYPVENPQRDIFIKTALTNGYYSAARRYIRIKKTGLAYRLINKIKNIFRRYIK